MFIRHLPTASSMNANFREFTRKQRFTFVFYLPAINKTVTDTGNFAATKSYFYLTLQPKLS
jgi:hypothetical protein